MFQIWVASQFLGEFTGINQSVLLTFVFVANHLPALKRW